MPNKIEFAIFSPQVAIAWSALLDRAQACEKLGFHSIWLVDHMWARGMPDLDHLECLTTMAGLAAATERIRIGTLVICNSYRNPALLAKSLTTIDHISNGRLEIGIGAGWMDEEYRAYGYEFPSMGKRLRQLEESLQVIKALFADKRANFKGKYYRGRRRAAQSQADPETASAHNDRRQRRKGDAANRRAVRRSMELSGRLRRLRAQAQRAQESLQGGRTRLQHAHDLRAVAGLPRQGRRRSRAEVADGEALSVLGHRDQRASPIRSSRSFASA